MPHGRNMVFMLGKKVYEKRPEVSGGGDQLGSCERKYMRRQQTRSRGAGSTIWALTVEFSTMGFRCETF